MDRVSPNHCDARTFGRRRALGALAGGLAAIGLACPAQAAERRGPVTVAFDFLDAAMDAYPGSGSVRLAQSYADQAGLFSTAFVYDNALAIFAYLTRGDRNALRRATALGDALRFAQDHDPHYDDGRLRQAYNAGPYTFYDGTPQPDGLVRADGTANMGTQFGFTGTAVGDMAWAGLALAALAERTGVPRFRRAAVRIGEWIERNARAEGPLGGYSFGVGAGGAKPLNTATEHNIDLVAFFGRLGTLTGDSVWWERRQIARRFVTQMWDPARELFFTGTDNGVDINRSPVPADAQTWSRLALRLPAYRGSLEWAASNLGVTDRAGGTNSAVPAGQSYAGITFSTAGPAADESLPIAPGQPAPCRQGVWFEGTAHLALALRVRGGGQLADRLLASLEKAQDRLGAGQTIGGKALPAGSGIVAASSPIDTGFGFGYYPYRHVGATAWYLLARARSNPLS